MERESLTKISQRHHIAAKPHRCVICDGEILPGEAHERLVYRMNDSLEPRKALRSVRFHLRCPPMEQPNAY